MTTPKLTRQGVRDLGGNDRRREEPEPAGQEYKVDIGHPGDTSGVTVNLTARSLAEALKDARRFCTMGNEPLEVRCKGRIVWDYLNGRL